MKQQKVKFIPRVTQSMARRGWFNWMPDEPYLRLLYWARMGQRLHLTSPQTFNEKLQWLKLYDRKAEYTQMVDKYEAKRYVTSVIGERYIIPTLGVWDHFDCIDFQALPNQFVLKCTHDSGGLVICRNFAAFDLDEARKKIMDSFNRQYYLYSREWPYKNVRPRIIAEKYMEDESNICLKDYKFYCFDGVPHFLYLSQGLENHLTAKVSYVTLDWELAPFYRTDFESFQTLPPKPIHFNLMLTLAEKLSRGIPFLRVDFYEINGNVYFSEATFFPGAGFSDFTPKEWNRKLGQLIKLPTDRSKTPSI